MLYLAKTVIHELPTNEKFNAEISHSRNSTLVSDFPERPKPLLFQYLHGDSLYGFEQHLLVKFFKLLTYDYAIDVIFPYAIIDTPMRKYIKAYKKRYPLGRPLKQTNLFSQELITLIKP